MIFHTKAHHSQSQRGRRRTKLTLSQKEQGYCLPSFPAEHHQQSLHIPKDRSGSSIVHGSSEDVGIPEGHLKDRGSLPIQS